MGRQQGAEDANASQPPSAEVSKSQRKREALAVRSLAAELIAMDVALLRRMPLDDELLGAILEGRRIHSNIARKRQLQYIAKLLRREDIEPIAAAIDACRNEARQLTARHHRTEAWRDRLLARGDEALSELMPLRPELEARTIRQLVRKAGQEDQGGRPPAAARALFRLLREIDQAQALPPCPDDG